MMKSNYIMAIVIATALLTINASASLLYVVDNYNSIPSSDPSSTTSTDSSRIITVDTQTGIETILNPNTGHKMNDIAIQSDGTIYTIGGSSPENRYLYRYDATGIQTGSWDMGLGTVLVSSLVAQSDGSLLMMASNDTHLWRIDLDTAGTFMSTVDLGSTGVYATGDIAIAPDSTIYFVGSPYSRSDISKLYKLTFSGTTPVATFIGHIESGQTSLTEVYGLTFDKEGNLFCGLGHRDLGQKIFYLDPTTAQATFARCLTNADGILGLASPTMPEPATVVLLGGGILVMRCIRRKP